MSDLRAHLVSVHNSLLFTLETVLSHTMARDLVHGLYVLRTEPVRIVEALRLSTGDQNNSRFPVTTRPETLPMLDGDPRLLHTIFRNASECGGYEYTRVHPSPPHPLGFQTRMCTPLHLTPWGFKQRLTTCVASAVSNGCKYGAKGGPISTEIEYANGTLLLRIINQPGENHEALLRLEDPNIIFQKGVQLHQAKATGREISAAQISAGDGAWIMQRCAECMQGECQISFEQTRTVFEMTCPMAVVVEELNIDGAKLADNVWALAVDDCEFQRMVLENMLDKLGLGASRVCIYGKNEDDLECWSDRLVSCVKMSPLDDLILAIVDENLDLPFPRTETISGSLAVQAARRRLTREEEARLLVLIRSANDSAADQAKYLERAHGFLFKGPDQDSSVNILRSCVKRFGSSVLKASALPVSTDDALDTKVTRGLRNPLHLLADNKTAAVKELTKVLKELDGWCQLPWPEVWKWLHRAKGIIATIHADREIVGRIESVRYMESTPADFEASWESLKHLMVAYIEGVADGSIPPTSC